MMLKLTIRNSRKAFTMDKFSSIVCPNCDKATLFRMVSPASCSNCLTILPDTIDILHVVENRYKYFTNDEVTVLMY